MITSFSHKGLKELFSEGKTTRLPQERLDKIKKVLAVIDAAERLEDLNIPAFRLHKLKKAPFKGFHSLDISGNYRVIFNFKDGKASDINYLDTH